MKTDDDTYVIMENLHEMLCKYNKSVINVYLFNPTVYHRTLEHQANL